jgi:hypothetical protein
MAQKTLDELEQIVIKLNKDLIAWQKWGHDFRAWVIDELNRIKAGRPNGITPTQPARPDRRDLQFEALMHQLKSMNRELDCIAAEQMFG